MSIETQDKRLNNSLAFHELRSDLLNKVLLMIALVALPATLLSLLRSSYVGAQPFMLTQLIIIVLLWAVVVGRQHLPYQWRIYALLFAIWATSFSVIAYLGPLSDSKVFLTAMPLFAMLFLDRNSGWLAVLLVFLTLTSLGVAANQYWLVFAIDYSIYAHHPLSWGLSIWVITAYSSIIAYVILSMMDYLRGRLDAVASAEQLLRELGNNIPDGAIYRLQRLPSGVCQFPYLSAAFAQTFDIDIEKIKTNADAFYEKIVAEDLIVVKRLESVSMRDLIAFDHVFRMYDENGVMRWLHGRAMPQYQADESVIWNGVFLDVSERKIAEQQRQISERRLQKIIDSLPVGVGVLDQQDHFLLLNRKFQQLFGYQLQDIPTLEAWAEKAYPDSDYRQKSQQTWHSDRQKAISKQRETPTREYLITAKDGHVHHTEVILSPGQAEHIVCFVDISMRRQVEASLHIYQQMVSSTKDMMAFLDANLVYQKANPAYAQAWGLSPQQIVGKAFDKVLNRPLTQETAPRLDNCLQGHIERFQQWREFAIGLRFVDVLYAPYRESPNQIGGITVSIRDLTELQQAREALQHSEERLRSIIASIDDLIFVQDANGCYQDSYQRPDDRLLLSLADFIGKSHLEVLPEPLCQQWDTAIQRVKAEKAVQQFEYPLNLPQGLHWFSANMSGRYDAQGQFVGVTSVVRDITGHKQLEASLRESQQRLHFALDAAQAGTFYCEPKADCVQWDERSLSMFGIALDEVDICASWRRVLHPEDNAEAQFQAALADNNLDTFRSEYRILQPDNGIRYIRTQAHISRNAQGEAEQISGLHFDITRRKEAEARLQESEIRYRTLFEAAGDLIFVHPLVTLDEPQKFLEVNQVACDVLGYSKERLLQLGPLDLLGASELPDVGQDVDSLLARQQAVFEKSVLTALGEPIYLEFHARLFELNGEQMVLSLAHDISRRKQAEAELKRLTDLLKSTQNLAHIGGWELDLETCQLQWTEEIYRIYELPQGFAPSLENSLDYYHADDRPLLINHFAQAVEKGRGFDVECRLISAEGQQRWVRVLGKAIKQDENIVRLHGAMQDISELKAYEQTLKQQEQRLQFALKAAGAGTFYYDFSDDYNDWDDGSLDIFGLSANNWDASLNGWFKHVHPDDLADLQKHLQQAIANQSDLFEHEYRIFRTKRQERHVRTAGYLVRNARESIGISGLHFDITGQKHTEYSLRHSRERLRLATAAGGIGIWEWRLSDHSLLWDEQMFHLYQMPVQHFSLPFERWTQAIHPEDREPIQRQLQKVIDCQLPRFDAQFRIIWSDQSEHYLHANAELRHTEAGKAFRLLGVSWDVTAQKQAEIEIIRAREEAEAASHAKSTFLANMSHELRTPLNAIMGYAQLLEHQSGFSAAQVRMISTIYRSGDYLLTLITDILDLAKIEAGRLDILPTSCDLKPVFQNLIDVFRMRAEQKSILFIADLAEDLHGCVEIDEKRLRQILMNLLSNAVKFTEQGEVTLSAAYQDKHLLLTVKDTGIGIAAEQKDAIFEPFQQFGESHYKAKGTGLGLAICRKLVELMHGDLDFDSQLGQGSEFRLRLPAPSLVSSNSCQTDTKIKRTVLTYDTLDDSESLEILVVDDVSDNRNMLRSLLESIGFGIQEVDSGEACLSLVRQWRPDLILLDLRMPGIDGLETVRRLRALPATQETPIIMVSASVFEEDQAKTLEAGCNAYLTKPIQTEALYEVLQTHLPLRWIYTQEGANGGKAEPTASLAEETLPNAQAKELLQRIKAGNINRIKQFIGDLENQQCCPQLTEQLNDYAARFQLKEMKQLVSGFIKD